MTASLRDLARVRAEIFSSGSSAASPSSAARQPGSSRWPSRSTKNRSRSPRRSVGREAIRRRFRPAAPSWSSTSASRPGLSSSPSSKLVASSPVGRGGCRPSTRKRATSDRAVVEAGLGHHQIEQLRRQGRRQRRRARSSRAIAAAAAADGAATTAAPPTASTSPAAQRAAATGWAKTRSTPAVVPVWVSSACAASMTISPTISRSESMK